MGAHMKNTIEINDTLILLQSSLLQSVSKLSEAFWKWLFGNSWMLAWKRPVPSNSAKAVFAGMDCKHF
jgi:hypothetical protein